MLQTHGTYVPIYARYQPKRLPLAIFPLSGNIAHENWQTATCTKLGHPCISNPKARTHGDIPYLRRVFVPFANCPSHWRTAAHNTGREIRGRRSWKAFWSKRGKVVPKVVSPKIVSPNPKGDGLWAFAWKLPKASSPISNKGWGSRHWERIFNTSTFVAHEIWGKVLKCQYWNIDTNEALRPKQYGI